MIETSLDYSGKTVCIIGGTSGIGNATAQAFRTCGADVHVTGTRPQATDYADDETSNMDGLSFHQLDAADDAAITDLRRAFTRLDVLICSQGMVMYKRAEFEPENFAKVVQVNLNSLMTCAGQFHDLLKEAAGSLIIISSTAAFHGTVGNPGYNASKAGAAGLTRTLGKAWAPDGIRVNGIAPGFDRDQDDQCHNRESQTARSYRAVDPGRQDWRAGGHGGSRTVSRVPARRLYRRPRRSLPMAACCSSFRSVRPEAYLSQP